MAVSHESWSVSGIDTSDQARVHIGHHNEYHEHRHYVDELQLSPAERQKAREDATLSSLYFTVMNARERAIDIPCNDTFSWIFDQRVTERRVTEREPFYYRDVCNLMSRWLEHEHGLFFIVGKAGSGKSTLMRFLAGHNKTRSLLQSWAHQHDSTLVVCAFYFWCSDSQLQCSQEGLWRTILYTIAKEDRKLASAMFPDFACDDGRTLAQVRSQPWSRNDLVRSLSLLVGQLEMQKVAVCLFIDGLDEYQGDEMMLIAELRQLLESPYIKICASSRPRNLFEQAFGYENYQWKLALHSLTRGDMVQLARTRLYEDGAFCKLVDREERRQEFVMAIAEKSQGVFLWTVLVIREMIREAHQAGTIDELKERLRALPIEIGGEKGMYQRIVERSDPRYRKYMARLMLLMLEPEDEDRDVGLFWEDIHFLYYDEKDPTFATRQCLELDDKYRRAWDKKAEEAAVQPWETGGDNTSCRGLFLVCHKGRSSAHPDGANCKVDISSLIEDTIRQIRKWCPDFVDTNNWALCFSHRSVKEYLSLPDIRERMADLAGPGYDSVLTRCRLRLAGSRLGVTRMSMSSVEHSFMRMITFYGHERRDIVRAILPDFERVQNTKWSWLLAQRTEEVNDLKSFWAQDFCYRWPTTLRVRQRVLHVDFDISRSSHAHAWFLSLVAREDLMWYCREQWYQVPTSDRQTIGTIIIAGLFPVIFTVGLTMSREQADLVQYLLRSGVDPNTKYTWIEDSARQAKASLCEAYVEAFPEVWEESNTDISWALEVMQLLLHDGHADRKCCLPAGKESLLSALAFKPHRDAEIPKHQGRQWRKFAGQLHDLLDEHGLLTREERHAARKQGWLSTKLKAPRSPQTTPLQSATEPDARPFNRWLGKLVG
jgi:energy-coupling factor transporter ATP-binding protein EcfA2